MYGLFQIKSIRDEYLTVGSLFNFSQSQSIGVPGLCALELGISHSGSVRDHMDHVFTLLLVQNHISLESLQWTLTWRREK